MRSFADGPLVPLLSYVASCVGVFLGLRCATRARACRGASRGRWLVLAALAIGSTGIWAMDFLALLGFSVSGETTRYNVLVALASLLVAVVAAGVGLLIIGVDRDEEGTPPVGSLIVFSLLLGAGLTVAHYLAMAAMRMPGRLSYDLLLVVISFVIAVLAAAGVLLGAARLRGTGATLGASLALGALLCGMHYTAMAAVRIFPASGPTGLVVGGSGGATASGLLLPVILSVSVAAFLVCAAIALSPTEEAIRYDAALLDRIGKRTEKSLDVRTAVLRPSRNTGGIPVWDGTASGSTVPGGTVPGGTVPGGTVPGDGTRLGNGTPFGNGTHPGNGTRLGRDAIPNPGPPRDDDPAPGTPRDDGPGPTGNQPPWTTGEPGKWPESH